MVFVRNKIKHNIVEPLLLQGQLGAALDYIDYRILQHLNNTDDNEPNVIEEDISDDSEETRNDIAYLYNLKGYIFCDLKNYTESVKNFDLAIELSPNDDDFYHNKSIALYYHFKETGGKQGKLIADAVDYTAHAIKLNPSNANYQNTLGVICYHIYKIDESFKHLDRAIELDPTNEHFYFNKGIIMHEFKHKESLYYIDKAISLTPEPNENYFKYKGMILFDQQRYKESIEAYDQAIKLNPTRAKYYSEKGLCNFHLGNKEEAIKFFDKALSLQPYNTYSYYFKGLVLFEQKKYEEAIKALDSSISINQYIHEDLEYPDLNNPLLVTDCYYYKGLSFSMLGRYKESAISFQKAIGRLKAKKLKIKPEYYGKLASVLLKLKDFAKSYEMASRAVEIDPNNHSYYDQKATALCLLNRYDEAIANFTIAHRLSMDKEYLEKIDIATKEKRSFEYTFGKQKTPEEVSINIGVDQENLSKDLPVNPSSTLVTDTTTTPATPIVTPTNNNNNNNNSSNSNNNNNSATSTSTSNNNIKKTGEESNNNSNEKGGSNNTVRKVVIGGAIASIAVASFYYFTRKDDNKY